MDRPYISDSESHDRFNDIVTHYERSPAPPHQEQVELLASLQARHRTELMTSGIYHKIIDMLPEAATEIMPHITLQRTSRTDGPNIISSIGYVVEYPSSTDYAATAHLLIAYQQMPQNRAQMTSCLDDDDITIIARHVDELETLRVEGHLSLLSSDLSHLKNNEH